MKALPRTVNLFVYGTLANKSLLNRLTGKDFSTFPAYLKDFNKLPSQLGYPYVVPSKGSRVEGFVIRGVDTDSLKKLDQYEDEGRLYFRKQVTATCGAEKHACEVYVGNEKMLRPRS